MNIKILNLHRNIKTEDLQKLFAKHGKVKSCEIVIDKETGKSKGFGFIEMNDEGEANLAISKLHGKFLLNQKIRVKAVSAEVPEEVVKT